MAVNYMIFIHEMQSTYSGKRSRGLHCS